MENIGIKNLKQVTLVLYFDITNLSISDVRNIKNNFITKVLGSMLNELDFKVVSYDTMNIDDNTLKLNIKFVKSTQ